MVDYEQPIGMFRKAVIESTWMATIKVGTSYEYFYIRTESENIARIGAQEHAMEIGGWVVSVENIRQGNDMELKGYEAVEIAQTEIAQQTEEADGKE